MEAGFFSLTFILAMYAGPTASQQERAVLTFVAKGIANEENQ